MTSEAEEKASETGADEDAATSFRGTREAPRRSGIPPAREPSGQNMIAEAGDEHGELALAESARIDSNLGALLRGLKHLGACVNAARAANDFLSRELETLRSLLARSTAEEFALRKRVRFLERAMDAVRRDASQERRFFIEQEDAFLAELMDDHERELADLKRRLTHVLSKRDSVPESSGDRTTTELPALDNLASAIGALKLRTVRIPLPSRPEEGAEALAPPRPSSRPPLRRKPDASTRPLVGYSLGEGDVAEEHVESTRTPTRPPNP